LQHVPRDTGVAARKGIEPEIVEYLKTPYTAAQLKRVLGQLDMPAGRLLLKKEAAAAGIEASGLRVGAQRREAGEIADALGRRAHRGDATAHRVMVPTGRVPPDARSFRLRTFRRDDWSNSNMVATALFGDGAGAALLTPGGIRPLPRLG
jgi:hypothetical protein